MRLLLAHDHDVAAQELAVRWADDAILMTPARLQEERLVLRLDARGRARAELGSRPGVTSVLTRLGGVSAADLDHVHPEDVVYAAAELDAFLRAWLAAWPGPVVNRPTATCLNGPGWRREQWVVAAMAVGLAVRPVRRRVTGGQVADEDPEEPAPLARVVVVGSRWFGPVRRDIGQRLCALAQDVGCDILVALLDSDVVVHVSAWPDVAEPEVAETLADLMDGVR